MTLPAQYVYQEYVRNKIVGRGGRTAVIAVPGCGKTRPVIEALMNLGVLQMGTNGKILFPRGPIIILCSGPAVSTWRRQLPQWTEDSTLGEDIHIVSGIGREKRMALWRRAATQSGIFITNNLVFINDFNVIKQIKWSAAIADEYHKFMRSRKSTTYNRFKSLALHMDVMILISGSLVSRNAASMFTAFQLCEPPHFRSYWKFVNTYCFVEEGNYGVEVYGTRNLSALHKVMDRYLAYVPEEVVADQLPTGVRQSVYVTMSRQQEKVYNDIAEDMMSVVEESGEVIIAPTILSMLIKLRQLLCCPRILDPSLGMGGGFELILEALELEPHMAIFVPFRPACVYVRDELRAHGYDVNMIRGGITSNEQEAAVTYFRNTGSILVCTISYAESFDLETCRSSYFLGYDYSLDQNKQAEGRTRRAISEHEFVRWNYIQYTGTIDDELLLHLNENMRNVRRILHRPQAIIDALKGISHE